ncbi:hypothetical protein NVS89_00185 [Ancylobacter sp. MQZ15Z-1]|uniref:Outer membrane protein beta-barrel domain-containing protein n=1 Tax=Ancylobacter mangrovi TaxID=2972472 RepID=A0A9X2T3E0_9HYPH|nr:hypothetical protein [Ancylobacter mangrovi]MCS0493494.1 hypothetical protein [Ancylobacter mangrovi]
MKSAYAAAVVAVLFGGPAFAAENELGVSITTQREPNDFNASKATVTGVSYGHTFDNNVVAALTSKYYDISGTDAWDLKSEAGLGYKFVLSEAFSITGIAALGSNVQSAGPDFPYYSLTASADWKVTPIVTWSIVNLRYRNAFDTAYDFDTPAVGTSLGFRIDKANSVSVGFTREWANGKVSDNEIGLGYKYHF